MVKEEIRYRCEICMQSYEHKESAENCEARGKGEDKLLPIGLVYGYGAEDDMYPNMVFAIIKTAVDGHVADAASWGCRDMKEGVRDNITHKEGYCRGTDLERLQYQTKVQTDIPAYKRLIAALKRENIKPILAADFLAQRKIKKFV